MPSHFQFRPFLQLVVFLMALMLIAVSLIDVCAGVVGCRTLKCCQEHWCQSECGSDPIKGGVTCATCIQHCREFGSVVSGGIFGQGRGKERVFALPDCSMRVCKLCDENCMQALLFGFNGPQCVEECGHQQNCRSAICEKNHEAAAGAGAPGTSTSFAGYQPFASVDASHPHQIGTATSQRATSPSEFASAVEAQANGGHFNAMRLIQMSTFGFVAALCMVTYRDRKLSTLAQPFLVVDPGAEQI